MPRRNRCFVPGMAYHITQRGVDRRETFSCDGDRETYLGLLPQNRADAEADFFGSQYGVVAEFWAGQLGADSSGRGRGSGEGTAPVHFRRAALRK